MGNPALHPGQVAQVTLSFTMSGGMDHPVHGVGVGCHMGHPALHPVWMESHPIQGRGQGEEDHPVWGTLGAKNSWARWGRGGSTVNGPRCTSPPPPPL